MKQTLQQRMENGEDLMFTFEHLLYRIEHHRGKIQLKEIIDDVCIDRSKRYESTQDFLSDVRILDFSIRDILTMYVEKNYDYDV